MSLCFNKRCQKQWYNIFQTWTLVLLSFQLVMFLNQHFNLAQEMDTEHRFTKDEKDGRPRLVTCLQILL